mmetsp:Transcript_23380/g.78956  ORF Transcript_23380/g.78956 Transcript_23380/m.78956 type:complete len:220 (-) Transcript_23380:96-755(-)
MVVDVQNGDAPSRSAVVAHLGRDERRVVDVTVPRVVGRSGVVAGERDGGVDGRACALLLDVFAEHLRRRQRDADVGLERRCQLAEDGRLPVSRKVADLAHEPLRSVRGVTISAVPGDEGRYRAAAGSFGVARRVKRLVPVLQRRPARPRRLEEIEVFHVVHRRRLGQRGRRDLGRIDGQSRVLERLEDGVSPEDWGVDALSRETRRVQLHRRHDAAHRH